MFEADIFNPDNTFGNISTTSTHYPKITVLVTQPTKFIARSDVIIKAPTNINVAHRAFEITESMSRNILPFDDVTYSLQAWSEAQPPGGFQWKVQSIFTNNIFTNLYAFISTSTVDPLISTWSQISDSRWTILIKCFLKENNVHFSCCYRMFKPLTST